MDEKTLKQFIVDAYGFIHWAIDNDHSANLIATTLTHDICGIAQEQECFSPRVSGYAKHLKEADKVRLGIS